MKKAVQNVSPNLEALEGNSLLLCSAVIKSVAADKFCVVKPFVFPKTNKKIASFFIHCYLFLATHPVLTRTSDSTSRM